jgi:hypothetical protein
MIITFVRQKRDPNVQREERKNLNFDKSENGEADLRKSSTLRQRSATPSTAARAAFKKSNGDRFAKIEN